MTSWTISELPIPASVDSAGFAEFSAVARLHFDAEAEAYGTHEQSFTAAEMLPGFLDQENQPTRIFVARVGDELAGWGRFELEPGERPGTAWLHVDVAPRFRRAGLATELADVMEDLAMEDGARKAIAYAPSAESDGDRLAAPTGSGSLPIDNREVRFLLGRSYRLEQVVRGSRLALPVDVGESLAEAELLVPGYALHYWTDHTPDRWRDDMALLRQRMSTEEPQGGLGEPEDVWTVQRLIESEQRLEGSPRTVLVAAVERRSSGHLVAFTAVSVPAELDRAISQEDTLVLPEDRGHALGMLLKLANLDAVQRSHPGHPSVLTFNAEENRHMLRVNEALGFRPIGYEGAWRKDL